MPDIVGMRKHAIKRLHERTGLHEIGGLAMIRQWGVEVPQQESSLWKPDCAYYLVYNIFVESFFVAVVDPGKRMVITILPERTVRLSVSALTKAKAIDKVMEGIKREINLDWPLEITAPEVVVAKEAIKETPVPVTSRPANILFYCHLVSGYVPGLGERAQIRKVGTAGADTYNNDPKLALQNPHIREMVKTRCQTVLQERGEGWKIVSLFARLGPKGTPQELGLPSDYS